MATDVRWWSRFAAEVRAAGHGDAPLDAPLRMARDGLGFDCAVLIGHGPAGGRQPVLVNLGYPPDVVEFLVTTYATSCPGHRYALEHGAALRIADLPFDGRTTRTYREALAPNGFREGLTLPLGLPGGLSRPPFVAMSSTHDRPLADAACLALTVLAHELAALADPGGAAGEPPAEVIARVRGQRVDLLSGAGAPLPEAGLRELAALGADAGLHHRGADGQWWRVRVARRPGAVLIRFTRAGVPITARELDVVGLVARGWPNERIAHALGISLRTARSHLESALLKVGAANRTALARAAFERDLDSLRALRCAAAAGGGG